MVEYHHKGTVRSGVHRQILHTCDLWSRIFQRDGTQQRLIFRINFVDVISSANVDFLCFFIHRQTIRCTFVSILNLAF